ncbi:tRNA uridine-5-carboxymethylaminomethyl(34) synthesis GTPase MnmE [Elusimicrobiota bacterium]
MYKDNNTITAIATSPGIGALAIVRLSGSVAFNVAEKIFKSKTPGKKLKELNSHTMHYGEIIDGEESVDEVILSIMKAPNSYTGEDMIEITCHGGRIIVDKILKLCIKNGARIADPGEFTKRAFLNGKMDLTQAEAVQSLIYAKSENSIKEALRILKGSLKDKINEIRNNIIEVKSNLDADIEWSETEDISTIGKKEIKILLKNTEKEINNILENSNYERNAMEGVRVVICGKTNAGKSSLFNCLLNSSRSIINKMPGTTRDVIDCEIVIDGYLTTIVDTAGLDLEDKTEIDVMASEKSREEIQKADTIIFVIDGAAGLEDKDYVIKDHITENTDWIPVVNKCDIDIKISDTECQKFCGSNEYIKISCLEKQGIEKLKEKIKQTVKSFETDRIMISQRQIDSLNKVMEHVIASGNLLDESSYTEIMSYELQRGLEYLGQIDGAEIEKGILDKIFSDFCIGK